MSSKGQIPTIVGISFRDKKLGWEKYGFRLSTVAREGDQNSVSASKSQIKNDFFEPFTENLYMKIFLSDLDLRPSCYACPAKAGKSCSSLTLGDYWNIQYLTPSAYNKMGVSLVIDYFNNNYNKIRVNTFINYEITYTSALKSNPAIEISARRPPKYDIFWQKFHRYGLNSISETDFHDHYYLFIFKRYFRKILFGNFKQFIRKMIR